MTYKVLAWAIALTLILASAYFIVNKQIYVGEAVVLRGNASIKVKNQFQVFSVKKLKEGDTIFVYNDSLVELNLSDRSKVRIASESEVVLKKVVYKDSKIEKFEIQLKYGEAWSDLEPLAPNGNFQVETPTIVAAVRGTEFGVSYINKLNKVWVNENKVDVSPILEKKQNINTIKVGEKMEIWDNNIEADLNKAPESINNPDKDYLENKFDLELPKDTPISSSHQVGPFLPIKPPVVITKEKPIESPTVEPTIKKPTIAGISTTEIIDDKTRVEAIPVVENKLPENTMPLAGEPIEPIIPVKPEDEENDDENSKIDEGEKDDTSHYKNDKKYNWSFWGALKNKWGKYAHGRRNWWSKYHKID